MSEADFMWPQVDRIFDGDRPKQMVMRHRRNWGEPKLYPVSVCVDGDRWEDDLFHTNVSEHGVVTITERRSDQVVYMYNTGMWSRLWLEYNDGHTWHPTHRIEIVELEVMTREEADG